MIVYYKKVNTLKESIKFQKYLFKLNYHWLDKKLHFCFDCIIYIVEKIIYYNNDIEYIKSNYNNLKQMNYNILELG